MSKRREEEEGDNKDNAGHYYNLTLTAIYLYSININTFTSYSRQQQ